MMYSVFCIGPDDVPRLRDEHSFLARQLAEVIQLAVSDQHPGSEVAWTIFARALEEHMRYEENRLFPAFVKSGDTAPAWADRFRADHEGFRRLCRVLGDALLDPLAKLETLRLLASQLVEHKDREGLVLYPWLCGLTPARLAWNTLHALPRGAAASD
jgi:iron-sulfur cluster repair protein YtfE (RIC family)